MHDLFIAPHSGFMRVDGGIPALRPGEPLPKSTPLMQRFENFELDGKLKDDLAALERGDFSGDSAQLLAQLTLTLQNFQRGITSGMTAFPVRENLEAEAKTLVPVETPVRNRLPRVPGSGKAVAWKQLTSLGGGWGSSYDQPGGGSAAQIFFAEAGAPAELTSVYADKSATYKLMGQRGSVTGFAMASGRNFFDQYAQEKINALRNTMLNEEFALINGDAAATAVPWGDGSTALSYNGLVNLITTANGVPAAQVQTTVGAMTFAHIDAQLNRLWKQGSQSPWILMNAQEIQSLKNLAVASGSIRRLMITDPTGFNEGFSVTGYFHPITGEVVPIIPSRFLAAGTILFCSDRLPDGKPALEVDVLPQVEIPELAPNTSFQGYVAQEIAPAWASPQVYGFLVSIYSVPKLKGSTVFAKSTGVTAV
jgi:hypothetical protein